MLRKRGQGLGILVSKFPKETAASYSLEEPLQVITLYIHNFVLNLWGERESNL